MAWTERQRAMLEALGLGLWVGPAVEAPADVAPDAAVEAVVEPAVEGRTSKAGGVDADAACAACPRRMSPLPAYGAGAPAWLVVGGMPEPEDVAAGRAF